MENEIFKILVVDDEKDIVDFVSSRLKREGYEVVTAFDGEEALAQIKAEDPAVIILDLMMPKLNGLEADFYLTKPCTMDNLVKGVKSMISFIPMRLK